MSNSFWKVRPHAAIPRPCLQRLNPQPCSSEEEEIPLSIELSVIIVNWNGMSFLPSCLEALRQGTSGLRSKVIVVDNASTDGSIEWLRSPRARVGFAEDSFQLIENGSNSGFGTANNLGIAASDSEFVFILNPDTEVRPGAIQALVSLLRSEAQVGACAPRLLNTDGTLQPSVWKAPPSPLTILLEGFRLWRWVPQPLRGEVLLGGHWPHDRRRIVKSFSGAAFMVRRSVIDQVGGFNQEFHMYGEEGEWYHRIQKGGWRLAFEPAAEVVHHGGLSTNQRWDEQTRGLLQYTAYLDLHLRCLPPWKATFNILAHSFVLQVLRFRRWLQKKDTQGVDEALALNRRYLRLLHQEVRR